MRKIVNHYFQSWRRKWGVVALVTSILCVAGWVRSLSNVDQFSYLQDRQTLCVIFSSPDGIAWAQIHKPPPSAGFGFPRGYMSLETFSPVGTTNLIYPLHVRDQDYSILQSLGFLHESFFLESTTSQLSVSYRAVRYWSLAVPLTLLSAYLLLSSPRRKQRLCQTHYSRQSCDQGISSPLPRP